MKGVQKLQTWNPTTAQGHGTATTPFSSSTAAAKFSAQVFGDKTRNFEIGLACEQPSFRLSFEASMAHYDQHGHVSRFQRSLVCSDMETRMSRCTFRRRLA